MYVRARTDEPSKERVPRVGGERKRERERSEVHVLVSSPSSLSSTATAAAITWRCLESEEGVLP